MTRVPEDRSTRSAVAVSLGALLASAAHWLAPKWVDLPQNPSGAGLGPFASTPALGAIAAVGIVGSVLSLRFRNLGAALLGAAAISSGFLVIWEFRPIVGLLPISLALPAVLLLRPSANRSKLSTSGRRAALVAIVAGSAVIWQSLRRHGESYGQTHPESTVAKPDWAADWLWVGAMTTTSATITAGGLAPTQLHQLIHWNGEQAGGPQSGETRVEAQSDPDGIARFELDSLDPDAEHRYRVVPSGSSQANKPVSGEVTPDSSFRTQATDQNEITVAFASCARTGSNGAVFDAIRAQNPDLFIHLGDLHYGNLVSADAADHLQVLGRSLSTPAQSALFSSIPCAWVWDDHDFGDNDSDSTSNSRRGVANAYRRAVPHWNVDPDPAKPISQAFTIGGVRIIITDTRSQRTSDTMLGPNQEAWLLDELITSSQTHAAVIWANPSPWNVPDRPGSDQWGAFPEERRRIANGIAKGGVTNLVMVSGDWHLSAIDDGTNTAYADDGTPGFPLVHGAPLDRRGAGTGEPYSHGVFANAGQFGTVRVSGNDDATVVTLSTHLWTGETMGELVVDFPTTS